VAMI